MTNHPQKHPKAEDRSLWTRLRGVFRARKVRAGRRARVPRLRMPEPGSPPGVEADDLSRRLPTAEPVQVTVIDYSHDEVREEEVHDLPDFLSRHRPPWSKVRWINVDGIGQPDVIRRLAEKYQLHPLAIEDLLHTTHRPKVEDYSGSGDQPGRLFIIARMVQLREDRVHSEQVSMFLGRTTLLTFQEAPGGDVFDSIRARARTAGSRLRQNDVSFLLYSLLDTILDSYFPILEHYAERLEALEEDLLLKPGPDALQRIHVLRRDLVLLRRSEWPMRELIFKLQREKHECLSETTQTFFLDLHDNSVQILDLIETYSEILAALTDTYMSSMSNRLNEVMKVLTIIGTIFIPLTFLAGVYGMNMPIPENQWSFTYPVFWGICLSLAGGMIWWFHRRGWI